MKRNEGYLALAIIVLAGLLFVGFIFRTPRAKAAMPPDMTSATEEIVLSDEDMGVTPPEPGDSAPLNLPGDKSVLTPPERSSFTTSEDPFFIPKTKASWYGPGFYGKKKKCGGRLSRWERGVASPTLACGTKILVENLQNGKKDILKVTDGGPYEIARKGKKGGYFPKRDKKGRPIPHKERAIDVTRPAAEKLGFIEEGEAEISIRILNNG